MSIVITELKTELATDPAGLGYAGKSVADIARLINGKTQTKLKPLAFREVLKWAAKNGSLIKLYDTANDATLGGPLRSACLAALEMIRSPHTDHMDPTDPDIVLMINALDAGGIINKAALVTFATQPASRAEVLWATGDVVKYSDITEAQK